MLFSTIMAGNERRRARPLLGTIVRITATGMTDPDAAISDAFAEIAMIHALMSFQSSSSDLGRIAAAKQGEHIVIDTRTRDCLRVALDWAARSEGVFDPVAACCQDACWKDIDLDRDGVQILRPLRVDLSGIAKGYAVDRATAVLAARGVSSAVVEAGGDLRVSGLREETVALQPGWAAQAACITLSDGALASSDPALTKEQTGKPEHLHGQTRQPAPDLFVSVAAPSCMDADALTKIVLADMKIAPPLLKACGATAYLHDGSCWSSIPSS
ncbi:Iron-sulfur cluster assembly/repair protein ApbE [Granulibacter bethesdensis]|nr:Iron-sulfur cluster assembly/repair protein ApbE [Granulibacter bethesdensis]